jgi:two-component system, NtrC family, sensor histidine kinase HydH
MPRSKLLRSAARGGPLLVALLLGALLVASSALSYRDTKLSAAAVAEREGVRFLMRLAIQFGRSAAPSAAAVRAAFEANRPLGLTYLRVGSDEAGDPMLASSHPKFGAPAFGAGRVRMAFPALPPPPFGFSPPPFAPERRPPPGIAIEFEPVLSADAVRRALRALVLSIGAAGLLAVSALVLWARARRAERDERRSLAQEHLAQMGEMTAILAHEIRNPLASLKGHAQLLEEKLDDPILASRVERVVAEAVRLEHLTTDLLDFARARTVQVVETNPVEPLAKAREATVPDRVSVSTEGVPERWPLDGPRIEQVLTNLVENALAVTPHCRQVEARVTRDGETLVYTVRDHGPGVPLAERERIFEPFHTTNVRGTGLGLTVAKRIVDLHRGHIDVLDAPGGGAEFRVCLPRL